jgi:NADPH-dependent 2,4-dienoyl-CoA reductase/sulfur reductase-like enzyme/peroxiredoxin family protein/rhodanese-related sulfurtransferase/TusA-related sulfurtransferase
MNEEAEITIIERGDYISFANCGLPYHIGGIIKERDNLLVQTVEGMQKRFNIDVKVKTEAVKIDRDKKIVILKDLDTFETYEESYDKLLLSPGAGAIKPPIPGANEADNIFALRNMSDMDRIIAHLGEVKGKRAVVIGAGFIGIEVAENLKEKGLEVSIVEKANQVLTPIDFELAAQLHQNIKDHNVELFLENGVKEFRKNGKITKVILEHGDTIDADIIIMSIGVKPETTLAVESNLEIGKTGGIKVNEYMQTSDEDIYAVGDAIEVNCFVSGRKILVPLAWPANRQGRLVADNILGLKKNKYEATMGTAIAKVFDYTAASTGMNEKTLKRLGIKNYEVITVNKNNHAGYYPGAVPLTLKLIYDKESGKIYGAQGIGFDGVDKRLDVIATAMKGGIKAWDLQDVELAYAPPFNSAKDPVNFFGYVAENIQNGDLNLIHWDELKDLDKNKSVLLDVRTKEENMLGSIPGSLNIDLNELRDNLDKLNKDKEYIVYCAIGVRGFIAYRILIQNGFKARNLDGGYKLWSPTTTEQSNTGIFKNKNQASDNYVIENDGGSHLGKPMYLGKTIEVDACGLQCPGPIMKTFKTMEEMSEGDMLEIKATDPGFKKDIAAWAQKTGNDIVNIGMEKGVITAKLKKGKAPVASGTGKTFDGQTMVVFSGDLDKVLASFIIANGALAMGKKVNMFFTFWGLSALKKHNFKARKSGLAKMFDIMLPNNSKALPISKMNMGGMGSKMIQFVMKQKNVDSLETLMNQFLENGGKITACTMSMDIMGIVKEELIDGIEYGGVAAYLATTENANSNLFI